MLVLAGRIEPPLDVAIECPHHADPRHHRRAVLFCDQDQAFHRCLPFRRFMLCFWQLGDVGPGVLQGDELPAVRQHNRIVEATLPGHSSAPPWDPRTETYGRTSGWAITLGVPPGAHQSLAACHFVRCFF
jgi:hypothetical protein